jgi:hypothetical protein
VGYISGLGENSMLSTFETFLRGLDSRLAGWLRGHRHRPWYHLA